MLKTPPNVQHLLDYENLLSSKSFRTHQFVLTDKTAYSGSGKRTSCCWRVQEISQKGNLKQQCDVKIEIKTQGTLAV